MPNASPSPYHLASFTQQTREAKAKANRCSTGWNTVTAPSPCPPAGTQFCTGQPQQGEGSLRVTLGCTFSTQTTSE